MSPQGVMSGEHPKSEKEIVNRSLFLRKNRRIDYEVTRRKEKKQWGPLLIMSNTYKRIYVSKT
jgi:hypothetical protein